MTDDNGVYRYQSQSCRKPDFSEAALSSGDNPNGEPTRFKSTSDVVDVLFVRLTIYRCGVVLPVVHRTVEHIDVRSCSLRRHDHRFPIYLVPEPCPRRQSDREALIIRNRL